MTNLLVHNGVCKESCLPFKVKSNFDPKRSPGASREQKNVLTLLLMELKCPTAVGLLSNYSLLNGKPPDWQLILFNIKIFFLYREISE